MFRNKSPLIELTDVVRSLPASCLVFTLEGAWLVISPSGVFVLTDGSLDVVRAADLADRRAQEVRHKLNDSVAFVPFVDAIVVADGPDFPPNLPALVIPCDMVANTVDRSARTIDDETLSQLALIGLRRAH